MGLFNRSEKKKDYKAKFKCDEGIVNFKEDEIVNIYLDDDKEMLVISEYLSKDPNELYLKYSQITNAEVLSEKEIIEKSKSVVGRAAAGTILLGPLGGILGGMSGIGDKKKSKTSYYFIVNYMSSTDNEIKVIRFKVMDIIPKVTNELRKRINIEEAKVNYL
jgi:hypothetical protein